MKIYNFGPGAESLPGPEVLTDFDPSRHRLPQALGIAAIPHNPQYLLRWFPGVALRLEGAPLMPIDEELIEQAQQHLNIIQEESEGTLLVPTHRSFIGHHPNRPDLPVVFSVVERLEGTSFDRESTATETAAGLYGLARYMQWVLRTRQPLLLSDVCGPHQLLHCTDALYMVDIDYAVASTGEEERIARNLQRLHDWRTRLPASHYRRGAAHILSFLSDSQTSKDPTGQGGPIHPEIAAAQPNDDPIIAAIHKVTETMR